MFSKAVAVIACLLLSIVGAHQQPASRLLAEELPTTPETAVANFTGVPATTTQAEVAAGCSFTLTSETLGAGTYQQRSCQVGSNFKVKIEFFSADDTMGFYIGDEPAGADGSLVFFRDYSRSQVDKSFATTTALLSAASHPTVYTHVFCNNVIMGCTYSLKVEYVTGVAAYTAGARTRFASSALRAVAAVTIAATLLLFRA